jgi:CO dehydrogenase nickel-insertion accessory protein CooC1
MIIAVSGKIGSGKDLVGQIIQYLTDKASAGYKYPDSEHDFNDYYKSVHPASSNWKIVKFADKLKECVSIVTGISREDLEKEEVKNSTLGAEWIRYG